jgi:hypothetical protein
MELQNTMRCIIAWHCTSTKREEWNLSSFLSEPNSQIPRHEMRRSYLSQYLARTEFFFFVLGSQFPNMGIRTAPLISQVLSRRTENEPVLCLCCMILSWGLTFWNIYIEMLEQPAFSVIDNTERVQATELFSREARAAFISIFRVSVPWILGFLIDGLEKWVNYLICSKYVWYPWMFSNAERSTTFDFYERPPF